MYNKVYVLGRNNYFNYNNFNINMKIYKTKYSPIHSEVEEVTFKVLTFPDSIEENEIFIPKTHFKLERETEGFIIVKFKK